MSAGIDIDPLDIIDDPNECKYKIGRVLQLSNKPILSIGTYESLDAECVIAGSSDKNIRFLEITSLDEITRCKVTKRNVSFVAVSEMSPVIVFIIMIYIWTLNFILLSVQKKCMYRGSFY